MMLLNIMPSNKVELCIWYMPDWVMSNHYFWVLKFTCMAPKVTPEVIRSGMRPGSDIDRV